MQCSNCGHERPRSGKCPHCGAAATGAPSSSHPSSLRGWREGAQSSGSATPSRPNWDDAPPPSRAPNSRPVSNNDSRARGGDAGWGAADQSFARRPGDSMPRRPGDSTGRRGDAGSSYARRDDFDDYGANDRALMPSPGAGGALMPQLDDRALPALPSEEEERALGIRRPAYIPATEVRKGERPSNIRVVSGVASIMLLCVAMLGVSGFLVQRNVLPGFLRQIGLGKPLSSSSVSSDIPAEYAAMKPLVTPSTNKTPLVQMASYQSYKQASAPDSPVTPQNPTDVFLINRFINIIGNTNDQTKVNDTISIKWYFNNVDVTPSIQKGKSDCCAIHLTSKQAGTADQATFQLQVPIATRGKAEVYYNGQLAYSILFLVVDRIPTPTPVVKATGTPAPGTPAPTKQP